MKMELGYVQVLLHMNFNNMKYEILFHAKQGLTKVHYSLLRQYFGRDRNEIFDVLLRKCKIKIVDISKTNWWTIINYEINT